MASHKAAVRLSLGLDVFVQIERIPQRLKSSILGLEDGRFILINAPDLGDRSQRLRTGLRVRLTYIHAGMVYGLKTNIVSLTNVPQKMIFL